jgi:hypothetical protein
VTNSLAAGSAMKKKSFMAFKIGQKIVKKKEDTQP